VESLIPVDLAPKELQFELKQSQVVENFVVQKEQMLENTIYLTKVQKQYIKQVNNGQC